MSHRLGSNINSPLFMTDPVPGRRPENHTGFNNNHSLDSFYVKGEETKETTADSYEHLGGKEDVFIINSQGGAFQLHRNTLKQTLSELKTQAGVSIRQLTPEHTEAFRGVMEALRLLYGSQALYDLVLTDIRNVFNDVSEIKPGTVAAFFIGCFNDDKFPGPMGCSPKCAASLPPTEGTPGYVNCDDLVLIYSGGLFSSLNEKSSSHAYIYIGDVDFQGFTSENLRELRNAGIENASLVFGNQDGTYREVSSSLPVDQLPITRENPVQASLQSSIQSSEDTNNNGAGLVVFIIILVIVVLLAVMLYRYFYL